MALGQQYTNFCCRSGGSNLNAGTRTGNDTVPGTSADFTYASGNWVAGTGVFTVASGNPSSDGVAVGDFASVYPNGSTVTPFVGRVTARDATTITVSLTSKSGTAPTNGTGDRTLKVGGAWRGPDSTTTFPLAFVQTACKDATGRLLRVNFKNDITYELYSTAVVSQSQITMQGFSSSYGDFGKAEIRGNPAANPVYGMIYNNEGGGGVEVSNVYRDFILGNNGDEGDLNASGHAHVGVLSYGCLLMRCSANDVPISTYDFNGVCVEGECYNYNFDGAANHGAWVGSTLNLRCIAHNSNLDQPYDISNVQNAGFHTNVLCYACIASKCHGDANNGAGASWINCDGYDSDRDGFAVANGVGIQMNCSATRCGTSNNVAFGYSLNQEGSNIMNVLNCRYGTGTEANNNIVIGGDVSSNVFTDVSGYPTNQSPWVDADNGNFTLFLDDAFETGRGQFTQTMPGYGGSVGYPDIGAARHESHVRNMVLPTGFGGGMA